MTKPTRAQIEAAEKVIKENGELWYADPLFLAQLALSAAAEDGPSEYTQGYRHGFAGYEEAITATIERCAQVKVEPQLTDEQKAALAKGFATILPLEEIFKLGWNSAVTAFAAAIRKLKDEA